VFFIASIFTPWAVVWATIPVIIAVTVWFWPDRQETEKHLAVGRKP
jgi:cytochrome c oxidase subunit I+III